MSLNDPLSDMIARIKNGVRVRKAFITCQSSKLKKGVLAVLKEEGYIVGYEEYLNERNLPELKVFLKYVNNVPSISEIKTLSTPGSRSYSPVDKIKKYFNGLGLVILSTSKGVLSDFDARKKGVGGELLLYVF